MWVFLKPSKHPEKTERTASIVTACLIVLLQIPACVLSNVELQLEQRSRFGLCPLKAFVIDLFP